MPSGLNLSIKDSTLTAAAGEYYVLARLCLSGKIAAQAPRGVPNADIVVTTVSGERLYAVQVKARRGVGADNGWHMKRKHEELTSDRLFYAFVDFGNSMRVNPTTYIVPSTVVASALATMHQAWLSRPGKQGQKHNDSDFRRFMPDYTVNCGTEHSYVDGWLDPYREAWELLS